MAEMAVANFLFPPTAILRRHEQEQDPYTKIKLRLDAGTSGMGNLNLFKNISTRTNAIYFCITSEADNLLVTKNNSASSLQSIKDEFKLSMAELARVFDVSRQSIYEWMDGKPLSDENSLKLNKLYGALGILKDKDIELSPHIIRRNVNGLGSISDAIKQNSDALSLAQQLKPILMVESIQRTNLARRMSNRSEASTSISDYAAPAFFEKS